MFLSIVITTYNRRTLVPAAIDSALAWSAGHDDVEIIVVDDCSTDGTLDHLRIIYNDAIANRRIRLLELLENQGVTGAKNAGAAMASGQWVCFLDSDDALRLEIAGSALGTLKASDAAIIFFRAYDISVGAPIGEPTTIDLTLNLPIMLGQWRWGDCIPFLRRELFLGLPYDRDLRGFEGLAYLRILKNGHKAILSPLMVLNCGRIGHERLSTRSALKSRACLLALGHWRLGTEFIAEIGLPGAIRQAAKICGYGCLCLLNKIQNIF